MKSYKNLHVVAFVAAMMALGAQAAVVSSEQICAAVSSWSSANGAAFASPGTAVSAEPVYDDDGISVLYWIVAMSNGGAVIASPDTDLDLVVAVLERYDGPLPANHPLPQMLKGDLRNRLSLVRGHGALVQNGTGRYYVGPGTAAAGQTGSSAGTAEIPEDVQAAVQAANAQWAKYGVGERVKPQLRFAASLEGGDASPYVKRIVEGFEEDGRFTFWNQNQYLVVSNSIDDVSGEVTNKTRIVKKDICFNAYTPDNVVCGCVATAGAAILQFFNCTNDPGEVTSEDATYNGQKGFTTLPGATDWSILPANMVCLNDADWEAPSAEGYELLARVSYNMGVLVNMTWAANGSGAYLKDMPDALKAYGFTSAHYVAYSAKEDTDGQEFFKTIYAQLWCGAPVMLGIRGGPGGHAVVGCGYARDGDGDEFCRVFMGWGGSGDAWYRFPKIHEFTVLDCAVTMIGYEDDAVVPVVGEMSVPGATLTLPGYKTNDVPVTVTVDPNGFFGIRVPLSLEDKRLIYNKGDASDWSVDIRPFVTDVLTNETASLADLETALPDEIFFQTMNMTMKASLESGKAVAEASGKALLVVSGMTEFWATRLLKQYLYHLDETTDISNKFVCVFVKSRSGNPNEPDGNPSIGVFDPTLFEPGERWQESNGRLDYENFIDQEASAETGIGEARTLVYTFSEDDETPMHERVDELLRVGYDAYLRAHSEITVTVKGVNRINRALDEEAAAEPGYGVITRAWTNGETVVFSAPGTCTNENAIYSCVGWTTNAVPRNLANLNYTAGAEATLQLFSGDDITLTWVWDVSHYRVTAALDRPYTSSDDWKDAVTPTNTWVAVGTRATVTAKDTVGAYYFDQWRVRGRGVDYDKNTPGVWLNENATAVSFFVTEPVTVAAKYISSRNDAPVSTTTRITFASDPEQLAAEAPLPIDGDFSWGENASLDNRFTFHETIYSAANGGVWACTNIVIDGTSYGPGAFAFANGTSVTCAWILRVAPEPGPGPVNPPTPGPIAITGVEQAADGSWTITVSGAVKDCWYWLYSTDDLAAIAGESDTWTAEKATTAEANPQQAKADGDDMTFTVTETGAKRFWRAKATSTEADD